MSIFKKKSGYYSVLTDHYVSGFLPTYGQSLENFVTGDYPMNRTDVVEAVCDKSKSHLDRVIATCDRHSTGAECDHTVDADTEHSIASHEAAIANNENQILRIKTARTMRMKSLLRKITPLQEKAAKLESEIDSLEGLHNQFQLHIGRFSFPIGLPITILAMLADAAVNYSVLQNVLLTNAALLVITVICLSIMSDGCMWGLAMFINHRGEKFTSKYLFWAVCIGLFSMFLLSVITSVMIRWGSMAETYGTINAAGDFVGKDSYSLAEYGVTLLMAFITTATGILSLAFSLDENAFRISIRERKKKELAQCLAKLDLMLNELVLLENAPDPREWDERKRAAAEHQIEAVRLGLKLYCREQMAIRMDDADFTERMAESGQALLQKMASHGDITKIPSAGTWNKVS